MRFCMGRGVPFSNNKMFWYLLNRAGLLQEAESDLKSDQLLKRIYDKKFLPAYGLNFLKVVCVKFSKKGDQVRAGKRVRLVHKRLAGRGCGSRSPAGKELRRWRPARATGL